MKALVNFFVFGILFITTACGALDKDKAEQLSRQAACLGKKNLIPFAGGDGSANTPYKICSKSQLFELHNKVDYLSMHFQLDTDIDLESTDFEVLGDNTNRFEGTFNGNSYSLKNLNISQASQDNVGIFAVVGANGIVKNLSVTNASVTGRDFTGIISGKVSGIIENCSTSGTVSGRNRVGGVSGQFSSNNLIFQNNSSEATVNGNEYVGGLLGRATGELINLNSSGIINARAQFVGGIVGFLEQAYLSESRSTAMVNSVDGSFIGGIAGAGSIIPSKSSFLIKNTTYDGSVTATSADPSVASRYGTSGGIIGLPEEGDIVNCHSSGSVRGVYWVGGITGYTGASSKTGSIITRSSSSMNVSAAWVAGGLSAYSFANSAIENSFFSGTVESDDDFSAGIVGYAEGDIINCYSSATSITGTDKVGGISTGAIVLTTNTFWDSEVSGINTTFQGDSNQVTTNGHNTATMKTRALYINAGWDETIWNLGDGHYPTIRQ